MSLVSAQRAGTRGQDLQALFRSRLPSPLPHLLATPQACLFTDCPDCWLEEVSGLCLDLDNSWLGGAQSWEEKVLE